MAFGCCTYLQEVSAFSMASPKQAKKSDLNGNKKV